ncbi:hypothetical protein L6164_009434 [Bauhinia variegata]|uniref:Uncharacterized protein n=1 Tax=Bauhinia variegata TaxID=167791 RepID=A0ACB9PMN0_BAUVA|nr:hypothetical protein L6164_009434 [Bauhinia variegata]
MAFIHQILSPTGKKEAETPKSKIHIFRPSQHLFLSPSLPFYFSEYSHPYLFHLYLRIPSSIAELFLQKTSRVQKRTYFGTSHFEKGRQSDLKAFKIISVFSDGY